MSGRFVCSTLVAALLCAASPALAVPSLPPQFTWDEIAPGAGWVVPVGVAFFPGGRMLVAEKQGRVWTVTNNVKSAAPLWQSQNEVLDNGDRGLLGIAVDPRYNGTTNRWIYLLYTVDPDSNGNEGNDDAFSRLIRVQVSATDSNAVDNSTRQVLFGQDWRRGPVSASPSHTIGALRWGSDGSLLVSVGDGAQFNGVDEGGRDAGAFGPTRTDPEEDIGAFRAQDITSLAGKVLRLNPDTGLGYASNPYWDGDPSSVRSRVWVYGLRNPYRFCVKPATGSTDPAAGSPGTLYVGDVGFTTYEETDIVRTKGLNFGWPCYEGFGANGSYQASSPAHNGCDSFGSATNPASQSAPSAAWHHSDTTLSIPRGIRGNTSIGGMFYTTNRYPAQYRGQYFFGDYGQNWIMCAVMDGNDNLIQILPFGTGMDGPVDFARDPVTGDVIYVAINVGQVRRIRYTGATGGNTNPIASASATPPGGSTPLVVQFSSSGSFDPDGDTLSFSWAFGDGNGSTDPNPSHTYPLAGSYTAQLTASDGHGGIDVRTLPISVTDPAAPFPSTPVLDNFNRANGVIGSPWVGGTSGLVVSNNQLTSSNGQGVSPVWDGAVFGPDQEAYITFNAVNVNAPEHDLMLKVQGTTYEGGHIEVRYTAAQSVVSVSTYTQATSWVDAAPPIPATFAAGDQLGARVFANGAIEVYKNGVKIGTGNTGVWPFTAGGGRIGLTVAGITGSLLDDFGGGNIVFAPPNTPPVASIPGVVDSSFYIAGDTLTFIGAKSDAQSPASALLGHWSTRLVHNNHFHIQAETDGDTTVILTEDHDDGTGVYLLLRYIVTDPGGLKDTATVSLFPENDLEPSEIRVIPSTPHVALPVEYRFWIRNHGRLPARISQWQIRADNTTLAQGDTVVAALDSVEVVRVLPVTLAVGTYTLRATVDTLGVVVETDEANNAHSQPVTVVNGTVDVGDLPLVMRLSNPFPNPTASGMSLSLELPGATTVAFSVHDLQGRVVWRASEQRFAAGRQSLRWNGRNTAGAPVAPGLYLARVRIGGIEQVRRLAVLR